MITKAEVSLWGSRIAAVLFDETRATAEFQYDPEFVKSSIQVSPVTMPLSDRIYTFPELPFSTFHGLPGLLSDSLPDKFGNRLIDEWLARQGREPNSLNPVERLCYIGRRGMGALEFRPDTGQNSAESKKIQLEPLVRLASEILTKRSTFDIHYEKESPDSGAMKQILSVGTSAGGARAKAIIAWNEKTKEIRSGQVPAGEGFGYWILKFDGVSGNKDKEIEDPKDYGIIEYAYYLMAIDSGIEMSECKLLEENGRHHFLTKRFDRRENYEKIHMQSLGALAHFDYNSPGAYSYEQAFRIMRNQLGLSNAEIESLFRRMAFNIVARNQDDHVKNIAFLMDKAGRWSLSPAFDITFSYNPGGEWTNQHQMSMNGKRNNFRREDFKECGKTALLKRGRATEILDEVIQSVKRWSKFAEKAGVSGQRAKEIRSLFRTELPA